MRAALRGVALWIAVLLGVIGLLGLQSHLDGEAAQGAESNASRPV